MNIKDLRKPTLATASLLNKFDVNLENGDPISVVKYVYIHTQPGKEVNRLSREEFEDLVFDEADKMNAEDVEGFIAEITKHFQEVNGTEFEVEPDKESKKKSRGRS